LFLAEGTNSGITLLQMGRDRPQGQGHFMQTNVFIHMPDFEIERKKMGFS